MMKTWSEDDTRWLAANVDRADLLTLSHARGFPLEELEARVRQLRAAGPMVVRKAPATLKEAQRELSAARREYEKAIEAFHKRQLESAAVHFEAVIERHPEEKELVDRSRMHLAACRSRIQRGETAPTHPEEVFHAAVFEKNRGNVARALELLAALDGFSAGGGEGRMHYLAACCHALRGDADQALSHLRKAIDVEPRTRIHARLEVDLSSLRSSMAFQELLSGA
jgi:tetratricopeptide (TPR) repeat protein